MKIVKASEYDRENLDDAELIIDCQIVLADISIENSLVKLENHGVRFENCHLENVQIFGTSSNKSINVLFVQGKQIRLSFLKSFGHICFESVISHQVDLTKAEVNQLTIKEYSRIENSNFSTAVFNEFIISDVKFFGGLLDLQHFLSGRFEGRVLLSGTKIDLSNYTSLVKGLENLNLAKAKVSDSWGDLKKQFNGFRLFLTVFSTFLFFVPLMGKTLLLSLFAQSALTKKLPELSDKIISQPIWESLLFGGKTGYDARIFAVGFLLALGVLGCKWMLTVYVSKLREQEEHRKAYGFSQSYPNTTTKTFILARSMSKAMTLLEFTALGILSYRLTDFLLLEVPYLIN